MLEILPDPGDVPFLNGLREEVVDVLVGRVGVVVVERVVQVLDVFAQVVHVHARARDSLEVRVEVLVNLAVSVPRLAGAQAGERRNSKIKKQGRSVSHIL